MSEVSECQVKTDTKVSPLTAKKVAGCPYYSKKTGCIIPDLCRQRGIEFCEHRTRWCQEINETDDQFYEWCLNHPVRGA